MKIDRRGIDLGGRARMKAVIGVMGAGTDLATGQDIRLAYQVGRTVAKIGAVLLSGGMSGVMEASCRGAKDAGGEVVAIGPTNSKTKLNRYVDIALLTGMGGGRNYINILSSDVVVAVGVHSPGTLSEIAFALQLDKALIVVGGTKKMKAHIGELSKGTVKFASSARQVQAMLSRLRRRITKRR